MKHEFTKLPEICPVLPLRIPIDYEHGQKEKTVILVGINRTGTSATAAMIHSMGIDMDGSEDGHFERPYFKNGIIDTELLREQIERLNQRHYHWGLQANPNITQIEKIADMVRNPWLIVVMRDPVATLTRWSSIESINEPIGNLDKILDQQRRLVGILRIVTMPAIAISFERLRLMPKKVARSVSLLLNVSPDLNQVVKVINPEGGYLVQK